MLEAFIRRPYHNEDQALSCVVEVRHSSDMYTLESLGGIDPERWDESARKYGIFGGRSSWKQLWRELRIMSRKCGESLSVVSYTQQEDSPIIFPDSVRPREAA